MSLLLGNSWVRPKAVPGREEIELGESGRVWEGSHFWVPGWMGYTHKHFIFGWSHSSITVTYKKRNKLLSEPQMCKGH